ncbi:Zn-dependent hydrolase [Salipaludibacillus aurantiacus]|uniref:Allantoate deiminase n=1 Tax=Salipaludibacillus aurantiacus TaxID=1601833 RepID=A0A1H9U9X0_9BACI|nr:Zn-dependent hydrolase [Salipaludibacillus aurantiacus]SES06360.1 allantoate deiminase [Salipaludibacillus aurantiacus]
MYEKLTETYQSELSHSGVDGSRLANRLHELSQIGCTDEGGSYRISFSKEEQQAKDLVKKWMEEAGLKVSQDGAGNVIGRLEGTSSSAVIMSGSHVDSVPNGGHFDGPLGVLSALEVAQAWKDTGYKPEKSYEVVVFTDEEGARFESGLTGSQAMTGAFNESKKKTLTDSDGRSFEDILAENGLSFATIKEAKRDFSSIEAFVEVHIEQGKRLEKENLPVGVVQGIAGPSWVDIRFKGAAGHAGNTPMDDRQDALIATGRFIAEVEKLPPKISPSAVATVGKLHVKPNGINVIPGEVQLTVDIRDIHEDTRDQLREEVFSKAKQIASERHLEVEVKEIMSTPPVKVNDTMQQKAARAMKDTLHTEPYFLPSGAGHDAMVIGEKTEIAMLFTRSKDGISHNPAEWSSLNDCVQTVHVLKKLLEDLCSPS